LPVQGGETLFPEKRLIRHTRADWTIRYPVGEGTPELEHLRADEACGAPTISREYSAIGVSNTNGN